jgi:histone H3/H4
MPPKRTTATTGTTTTAVRRGGTSSAPKDKKYKSIKIPNEAFHRIAFSVGQPHISYDVYDELRTKVKFISSKLVEKALVLAQSENRTTIQEKDVSSVVPLMQQVIPFVTPETSVDVSSLKRCKIYDSEQGDASKKTQKRRDSESGNSDAISMDFVDTDDEEDTEDSLEEGYADYRRGGEPKKKKHVEKKLSFYTSARVGAAKIHGECLHFPIEVFSRMIRRQAPDSVADSIRFSEDAIKLAQLIVENFIGNLIKAAGQITPSMYIKEQHIRVAYNVGSIVLHREPEAPTMSEILKEKKELKRLALERKKRAQQQAAGGSRRK